MKRTVALGIGAAVLLSARVSAAGALGIPLDGFLTQFQTFVVGLGLIMGLVGLTGYVGSLFDNPFRHSVNIKPEFGRIVGQHDSSTLAKTYQTQSACFA